MTTRILLTLALATALSTWANGASLALEPGVHGDPGSPAAKQYALPLNQARQTGSSRDGLFGAGIKRSPPRATAPASTTSPDGSQRKEPELGAGARTGTSAREGQRLRGRTVDSRVEAYGATLPAAVQSASRAGATSSGSLLALIGGGVAVLVLGVLGGTVLKGRRSDVAKGR